MKYLNRKKLIRSLELAEVAEMSFARAGWSVRAQAFATVAADYLLDCVTDTAKQPEEYRLPETIEEIIADITAYEFGHVYAMINKKLGHDVSVNELGVYEDDDILVAVNDRIYEFYQKGDELLYSIIDDNGVPSDGVPVMELFKR